MEEYKFTKEQALLIEKWLGNTTFVQTLSIHEVDSLKRISSYTNNLLRDSSYHFVYGKYDKELLTNIRQRWITFKRIHEKS